jgi:hypothetical protein
VILEGIVTTLDEDGAVRVAPMGPTVEPDWQRLQLRPFTSSHTFENLKRTRQGVFHVTDDVELIARAAVGQLAEVPPVRCATSIKGMIICDACRWYSFQVESLDEQTLRATLDCRVIERGFQREFFGLCRAKHAVVEAAILATRVHLLEPTRLRDELQRLAPLVEKTGGVAEQRAFTLLQEFILAAIGGNHSRP